MHRNRLKGFLRVVVCLVCAFCALTGHAGDASEILTEGIAQYEKGNFQKAIRDLAIVVQQFMEDPEGRSADDLFRANLYLGLSYLGTGEEMRAREMFTSAVRAAPGRELDPVLFSPKVISLYNEVAENTLSHLSVESNVTGAEVFVDDVKQGMVPIRVRNLLPGEYTVAVVFGNQKTVREVALGAGERAGLAADFESLGSLSVTSAPASALVFLDSREVGTTPITKEVPSGEYSLVISKEDYQEIKKQVTVREDVTEEIHVTLLPAVCSVGIFSEPEGADVYLDSTHKGTTPLLMKDVTGGTHLIKVEKEGYLKIQETLDADQMFMEKTFHLQPVTGSLSVHTDPDGASVLIDGQNAGLTPLQLRGLGVKEYRIQLEKKGYIAKTLTADVRRDEATEIRETLLPVDSQPPTISFVPLEKVGMENRNYVRARVSDDKGVGDVSFMFTYGDWRYGNRVKMQEKTKGVFEALIPATLLKKAPMKYYISACDIHENCAYEGSQDSPFTVKVMSIEPYTEGYILNIIRDRSNDIERLIISVGVEDGVRKGDRFVVFRTGRNLRDPATDELLQIEEMLVGTIEVTELLPRTSYAEVDDDFVPLQENDRIRRVVSAPKGLIAEGRSRDVITLRWSPNTEPEVKGYRIFRSAEMDGSYERIGTVRGRDTISYKDDDDIEKGVTYYYRLTAYNILEKDSEMSEPVAGTAVGR